MTGAVQAEGAAEVLAEAGAELLWGGHRVTAIGLRLTR